MRHLALLLPLALGALPATAAARPHDGPGKGHEGPGKGHGKGHDKGPGPCRADRDRLCKDAGGKSETHACMLAHKAELAPACREQVEARAAFQTDCKAPLEAYCAEVPPGRGAVMGCLIGRKADLQPACRKHVDEALARFAERRERRGNDGKDGKKPEGGPPPR
jgi:hypothetical protein